MSEGRTWHGRVVVTVLLPLLAGALVASGSGGGVSLAAAIAVAPLVALAVSALSVHTLLIALVVATQVQIPRVDLFGFHFLPEHFVLVGLAAALLIRAPQTIFRRPAAYELLLLAWVLWNAVTSLLQSTDVGTSMGVVGWMFLAWLIMWTARGVLLLRPDSLHAAIEVGAWFASVLGLVAFGVWLLALLDVAYIFVQPEFVTGAFGAKGLALEANILGAGELMWLYWLLRQGVLGKRSVPGWQVTALTLGIAASMTRAVWVATIVVVVGTLCVRRPSQQQAGGGPSSGAGRGGPLKLAAALAIAGVVLAFATPAGQKFSESLNFQSATGATRVSSWQLALNDLDKTDAYVTGLGTNSYGSRHLSPTDRGQPDYLSNLPLTLLYDSGLIGLSLFFGAMLCFVMRTREVSRRLMTLLFVIGLLIAGAATNPIWFGFVWVMIAAIDADNSPPPALGPAPPPERDRWRRVSTRI